MKKVVLKDKKPPANEISAFLKEFGINSKKTTLKWKEVMVRKFPPPTTKISNHAEETTEIMCNFCKIC
jgi:hypothetical protein